MGENIKVLGFYKQYSDFKPICPVISDFFDFFKIIFSLRRMSILWKAVQEAENPPTTLQNGTSYTTPKTH